VPKALPATTFVFERKVVNDRDHLVAMDFVSLQQRVITTLTEGTVEGYKVDGVTVSPDRTRLVIASLYGPTAADVATGLATNRLWSLDTEGQDFLRLTPVFPNSHAGQTGWRIDVRDPAYSPDGKVIVFDYGEGNFTSGYVAPWVTAADGSTLPSLFDTNLDCSVNGNAAFNPVTGDLLLAHVVCIGGVKGGYYLYPKGGGAPDYLVNEEGVSLSSEPPAFSVDGSIFAYTARTYSDSVQSLYAYIMSERRVVPLVLGAVGRDVVNASFAPDNMHMVYCVKEGDAYNLRLLNLGADPPTDTALTSDGVSCDAVF
jgi:Tol biopolymer transport system component